MSFAEKNNIVIALVLGSKEYIKHVWEYDSTLTPVRIVAGIQDQSRIEFTANILGEIGNNKSIPVLLKLISHEAHNVRWEAARSLVKLDIEKGKAALEVLKNDNNPEVRQLARLSLKQFIDT